jgi:hypothetical protein
MSDEPDPACSVLFQRILADLRTYVALATPRYKSRARVEPYSELLNLAVALRQRRDTKVIELTDPASILCNEPKYEHVARYLGTMSIADLAKVSGSFILDQAFPHDALSVYIFVEDYKHYFRGDASSQHATDIKLAVDTSAVATTSAMESAALVEPTVIDFVDLSLCFHASKPSLAQHEILASSTASSRAPFSCANVMSHVSTHTGGNLSAVTRLKIQWCGLNDSDAPILLEILDSLPSCKEIDVSWNRSFGLTLPGQQVFREVLLRTRIIALGVVGFTETVADSPGSFIHSLTMLQSFEQLCNLIWLPPGASNRPYDWAWIVKDADASVEVQNVHHEYYGHKDDIVEEEDDY